MTNDQRTDHNIWPLLTSGNALELRRWLTRLGFEEGLCLAEGDHVQHSEMLWPEGGRLMVCTARPGNEHLVPAGVASIYITTERPDEIHSLAVALGATITRDLYTTDFGSRTFSMTTPEGHQISFGTYAGGF